MIEMFRMKCRECLDGIWKVKFDGKIISKANKESSSAVWSTQEFEIINVINM